MGFYKEQAARALVSKVPMLGQLKEVSKFDEKEHCQLLTAYKKSGNFIKSIPLENETISKIKNDPSITKRIISWDLCSDDYEYLVVMKIACVLLERICEHEDYTWTCGVLQRQLTKVSKALYDSTN